MLISIVIYGACLALLFWGSSFAKNGQLKSDYLSLESSNASKGFACIGVMLHHISQNPAFHQTLELNFFEYIGFLFVGIFFFYSGIGLLKSWKTKPNYLATFFKKRMLPIIVAIYVMNLFYAVFALANHAEKNCVQWILGLLNIILLNDQGWYPIVILIMYAAFAVSFKKCRTTGGAIFAIFCVALIQLMIFVIGGHFAWWIDYGWYKDVTSFANAKWYQNICALWFQGEWWVNSTMCFVMGLLWAHHESKIISFFSKDYAVKTILCFILMLAGAAAGSIAMNKIGYWSEFRPNGGIGRMDKAITLAAQQFQLATLLLFLTVLKFKWTRSNKVLNFFSSISLEFYLMQRIALNSFAFLTGGIYKYKDIVIKPYKWNLALYLAAVICTTLVLALVFKFINRKVVKLLSK